MPRGGHAGASIFSSSFLSWSLRPYSMCLVLHWGHSGDRDGLGSLFLGLTVQW